MTEPFIHPDLQEFVDNLPARPPLSNGTLDQFRQGGLELDVKANFPNATPPICHQVDGAGGMLDIYQFAPSHQPNVEAALLWIHGGGYIAGQGNDPWFGALFAEKAGVRVFSVDYRLAPEHPFPAGRDDVWFALNWLSSQCEELAVDPSRIAIGGASAGAGLAAALAIYNRDQNGPNIAFQLLLYPMLDHLHDNEAGHKQYPRWTRENSLMAWQMYLGGSNPTPYSVAALASDLSNLPSAYLCVGEADLFLDDICTYASRLDAADVKQQLRTYAGVFHGAEMQGYTTQIGRAMSDDYSFALSQALQT